MGGFSLRASWAGAVILGLTLGWGSVGVSPAIAQDKRPPRLPGGPPKERFEEHKKEILTELDERLRMVQSEKSCISSASDPQAMHQCRESARAEHEKFRAAEKQRHMHRIDEQIQHLQDQKKHMESEGAHGPGGPGGPGGPDH